MAPTIGEAAAVQGVDAERGAPLMALVVVAGGSRRVWIASARTTSPGLRECVEAACRSGQAYAAFYADDLAGDA